MIVTSCVGKRTLDSLKEKITGAIYLDARQLSKGTADYVSARKEK